MEASKTTIEMINKVKEQYKLYSDAIKPYYYSLHSAGIVTIKSNEIFIDLFIEYMKKYSINYNEVSKGRYFVKLEEKDLEVFISQGTMHITNTDYHKTYYLQLSLEITNIYYGYNLMFFDYTDKFGETVERLYINSCNGKYSDVQMMQFIQKMQSNLLRLNQDKHYMETHNSYKDYEYELIDTVYTDDNGKPIQYKDFENIWQVLKDRISEI